MKRGRVRDKPYLKWCALQPCCVTNELPATTHHVRLFGSPRDDRRVIRLAARLHMHDFGMESIERLGKQAFELRHRIQIEAEIRKLRERYEGEI